MHDAGRTDDSTGAKTVKVDDWPFGRMAAMEEPFELRFRTKCPHETSKKLKVC
jgi:hypothetical protein